MGWAVATLRTLRRPPRPWLWPQLQAVGFLKEEASRGLALLGRQRSAEQITKARSHLAGSAPFIKAMMV